MIALYIIGGIVLLIIILLMSSVSLRCIFDDDITVKAGYLFVRKTVVPTPDKKHEKKKKTDTEPPKKNYIKQLIEEKGLAAALSELGTVAKVFLQKAGRAAKHIRVKKFDMLAVAASYDPAKTAVEYGALCAAVFPMLSGFQQLLKWNEKNTRVSVQSDFCSEKPTFFLDFKIKLRLWFILKAGIGVLWTLIKLKISKATEGITVKSTETEK